MEGYTIKTEPTDGSEKLSRATKIEQAGVSLGGIYNERMTPARILEQMNRNAI